jgi:hypothetical protein
LIAVIDSLGGEAYLVDPSFDQVIAKLHTAVSFQWKPKIEVFQIPQASDLKRGAILLNSTNCGQCFVAHYTAKRDMSYRKNPDWNADEFRPLTERILTEIRMLARIGSFAYRES